MRTADLVSQFVYKNKFARIEGRLHAHIFDSNPVRNSVDTKKKGQCDENGFDRVDGKTYTTRLSSFFSRFSFGIGSGRKSSNKILQIPINKVD